MFPIICWIDLGADNASLAAASTTSFQISCGLRFTFCFGALYSLPSYLQRRVILRGKRQMSTIYALGRSCILRNLAIFNVVHAVVVLRIKILPLSFADTTGMRTIRVFRKSHIAVHAGYCPAWTAMARVLVNLIFLQRFIAALAHEKYHQVK